MKSHLLSISAQTTHGFWSGHRWGETPSSPAPKRLGLSPTRPRAFYAAICRAAAVLVAIAVAVSCPIRAASESAPLDALMHYESGADATPLRQYEQLVAQSVNDAALRASVEADLLRVLAGDSTFEAKRFACLNLAVIGTEASVPALAALLKQDETVGIACAALAQNPSPKATAELRKALGSTTGRSQAQVAHALGVRKDTKAVAQLNKLTSGSYLDAAEAAIVALGKIGTPGAQKTLAALRQECPEALSRAVVEASLSLAEDLAARGRPRIAAGIYGELLVPSRPVDIRRGAFGGLVRLDRDGGEKRIVETLRDSDATLKPTAIAATVNVKASGASKKFAAELPKLEPHEQVLLIEALAQRGDPAARVAVQEQLGAADKSVRLAAIQAVGQDGDAATVPVLARALPAAQSPEELKAIELALASLRGGDDTDKALMAQLRNRMAGPKTPILAALVHRANRIAFLAFVSEAGSSDAATAKLAFQGLSRVAQPDDVAALLQALAGLRADGAREEAEASIGQVLNRAGDPAGHSAAVREALTQAKTVPARCSLLRLLVACPDAPALATVKSVLGDADPQVKEAAMRTLADWPNAAAWEPLIAVYRQAGSETERVLALRGLARLLGEENAKPDAQLIGRYRELLGSAKGDNDRKLVLGPLAGCAHPDALKLAVEQLDQPGVRAEAAQAVKAIAEAIKPQHPQEAAEALKKIQ